MVANAAKKAHDQLLKKLRSDKKYADIKNLNLKGNGIVNLTHFGKELEQMMAHNKHCPQGGSTKLDKVKRDGLYTVLVFRCHDCGLNINIETRSSKKIGGKHKSINIAAVWGMMSTGGGHAKMDKLFSALDVPALSKESFLKAENFIGDKWKEMFTKEMIIGRKSREGSCISRRKA